MGKKYLGIVFSMAFLVMVTGCGTAFPELTETQYNQTVEYAVGLLMKYSNNDKEKLVYVNVKETQKQGSKKRGRGAGREGKI